MIMKEILIRNSPSCNIATQIYRKRAEAAVTFQKLGWLHMDSVILQHNNQDNILNFHNLISRKGAIRTGKTQIN